MRAVFDTNILIDHLGGHPQAAQSWASYPERLISRITFLEVLVGADTPEEEADARALLNSFQIVELGATLSEEVLHVRKTYPKKLKLPDAIIYATARSESCPLITRNSKDFPANTGDVIEPYVLP